MRSGFTRHARSLAGLFGLLAALSGLAGQLALGASVPTQDAALLAAAGTICHVGEAPAGNRRSDPPPHRDCAICPLCVAMSVHAVTLAAAPAIVRPAPAGAWQPGPVHEAISVLVRLASHAQPTGPPLPI
jgi:hypothetical protein